MADTYTTNLNLTKPEPGAAEDTWGISLNSDLDTLDAIFSSSGTQINLNPNQVNFADNKKAIFGTSNDMQIFHDGSNSFIKETGTGDLRLLGSTKIDLRSNDDATVMIRANAGGSVDLRYAGNNKLTTTSSGIDIVGTATMDGLTVDGDATISDGNPTLSLVDTTATNQGAEFKHNAGTTTIQSSNTSTHGLIKFNSNNGTDTVTRMQIDRFGDISFYDDTGTSENLKWDASADTLNFVDNAKAQFGTGNDLQIYHTGSHSYIDSYTGNLYINSDSLQLTSKTGGENYIRAFLNGAVDIYYDNAVKLATTSTGVDVTGTLTSDGLTTSGNLNIVSSYPRINLTDTGENPDYSIINADGIFNIYDVQNASNRLSISSTGNATFAGTVTSDGLTVDGTDTEATTSQLLKVRNSTTGEAVTIGMYAKADNGGDGNTGSITFDAGADGTAANNSLRFSADHQTDLNPALKIDGNRDISFYDDTGSTQGLFWDASAENLFVGGTSTTNAQGWGRQISSINSGTNGAALTLKDSNGEYQLASYANNFYLSQGANTRFFINSSGSVGIGTTSPSTTLELSNASTAPILRLSNENNAITAGADLGVIEFYSGDDSGGGDAVKASISAIQPATSPVSGELVFKTSLSSGSLTTAMTIDSSQRVGIGTTSPSTSARLTLDGSGAFDHGLSIQRTGVDDPANFRLDGASGLLIEQTGAKNIKFETNNSEVGRFDASGNFGIGTTNPERPLHISGTNTIAAEFEQTSASGEVRVLLEAGGTSSQLQFSGASHASLANTLTIASANHTRFVQAGQTVMYLDSGSGGRVGIGTDSPNAKLESYVSGNFSTTYNDFSGDGLYIQTNGTVADGEYTAGISFSRTGAQNARSAGIAGVQEGTDSDVTGLAFFTHPSTATAGALQESLRISADGSVGIGTDSPSAALNIVKSGLSTQFRISNTVSDATTKYGAIVGSHYTNAEEPITGMLMTSSSSATGGTVSIGGGISAANAVNNILFYTAANNTTLIGSEAGRFDSSGNLLVGKSSSSLGTAGHEIFHNGVQWLTASNSRPLLLNRLSTDGTIAEFRKDGTTVGSIGVAGGDISIGTGNVGFQFWDGGDAIYPWNSSTNSVRDGAIDLGYSGGRFQDIYATNGTIQTSDINEKQDIEDLSEAETRVAVAAKGLLKKYRWKSAVADKGDDARIHFGIMAQDLQQAFSAEGLDAGDYGMFISSTWTDETTGEEKTRLGVRYNELLAFIIAAI